MCTGNINNIGKHLNWKFIILHFVSYQPYGQTAVYFSTLWHDFIFFYSSIKTLNLFTSITNDKKCLMLRLQSVNLLNVTHCSTSILPLRNCWHVFDSRNFPVYKIVFLAAILAWNHSFMTSTSSPFSFGESSSLSNNNACHGREESTRHDTMYYEIVATGYVFL